MENQPVNAHDTRQQDTGTPVVAELIASLGLDETVAGQVATLTSGLDAAALTPQLLHTLAQGITHDDDVSNADAQGYLRGRNEKIETVIQPQRDASIDASPAPVFPQYRKRSVWD